MYKQKSRTYLLFEVPSNYAERFNARDEFNVYIHPTLESHDAICKIVLLGIVVLWNTSHLCQQNKQSVHQQSLVICAHEIHTYTSASTSTRTSSIRSVTRFTPGRFSHSVLHQAFELVRVFDVTLTISPDPDMILP